MSKGSGEPLMAGLDHQYMAIAADEAAEHGNFSPEARKWDGGLWKCCGSCDLPGCGSFFLAKLLPCVAFGRNARHGLKQSAWLHGILYLVLFILGVRLATMGLIAANHNVLASCNGGPPHSHHHGPPFSTFDLRRDNTTWARLAEQKPMPGLNIAAALEQAEDMQKTALVSEHHDHEDDGNDGDHGHDKHHHDDDHHDKHHDKDGHDKKHHDDKDGHHDKHDHDDHGKHGKGKKCQKGRKDKLVDVAPLNGTALNATAPKAIQTIGDFANRKLGGMPADQHMHGHREDALASPECRNAVVTYCGAWGLLIAVAVTCLIYAARRRTMLREKFGIAGSKFGDVCTWCWCAPCALCQETRTLWTNNVREGVWNGPMQAPTATGAPASQFMTV